MTNVPVNELKDLLWTMTSAIAPVTLISGVALLVSTMVLRFGRTIDRVRALLREQEQKGMDWPLNATISSEIRMLHRRARTLRTTIILASTSIFCVALSILFLFLQAAFGWSMSGITEVVFLMALLLLTVSLVLFIQDFAVSLHALKMDVNSRLGTELIQDSKDPH